MNQDLTYGKNFADFLGSFWSQIFDNGALGDALGFASSEMLVQNYMDLVDVINSSSIYDVPILSRKNIFPIIVSKNKFTKISEIPQYGSGGYFGIQPDESKYLEGAYLQFGRPAFLQESYFCPISNTNIKNFGGIALNRLFEPSVTLTNNTDFLFTGEGIIFRSNIFENELFPTRETINPETGETDVEIVIWFCDVEEDKQYLYNQYGYIFTNYRSSTEEYKQTIQNVFELISRGPSFFRLDAFLSAISGSPIIKETQETIEKIVDSPEGILIITDKNVYSIDSRSSLRGNIQEGATLPAGSPLSNAVEVFDVKNRYWWQKFLGIPLKKGATTNTDGLILFPNKIVNAQYGKSIVLGDGTSYSIKFELVGNKGVIDKFWKNVYNKSKKENIFYGYEIFKKHHLSDNYEEDFEDKKPFFVNPAQIFSEDLLFNTILPVRVNLRKIKDPEFFFRVINPLTANTPVHVALMIFFEFEPLEQKDLDNSQGVSGLIDLADLLSQNISNYPTADKNRWTFDVEDESIKEGLSYGLSFGNMAQSPDEYYSDRVIEKFDLSNTNNLVQNVELRLVKKCEK